MKMTFVLGVLAAMVAGCDGDYPAQSSQAESWSTAFRIVLPDEPKPWEKTAAEELEHYLGHCLGRDESHPSQYVHPLTVEGQGGVVFHVGDTAFARDNLFPASYQQPTTNYQLPTTNYQLSTTNYQLPTTNCPAPT